MKVEMDMYAQIRRMYNEGESQRSIAKKLGISRQTVKKYCAGETTPEVRKSYERTNNIITDEVKSFILECFQLDEQEHVKKQTHTAKRIYDRLVSEKGYIGSYSSICKAVRELKPELLPVQADLPLAHDPGDAIQIDWGEVTLYVDGIKTKANIFCGRLCYSCAIFVQVFQSQNLESFLEAQQRMFDFFDGVPHRLIFDNAKVAVKDGFGLHAKATDGYRAFAAHYAFQTDFCNAAKGNEKGLVENLVGYARNNFFVPLPRVKTLQELNATLLMQCQNYNETHKISTRNESVKEAYEIEQQFLYAKPAFQYDTSRKILAKVNDYSLIRFEKNNYSVPTRYLRQNITVKGYSGEVQIFHDNKIIAVHDRLYGHDKTAYRLEHYIDLIAEKPRAVFQAKPVRENISEELLRWGKQLPGGNYEMVKLLRLCIDYGEDEVLRAKEAFPKTIVPSVDMIRTQLHRKEPQNIVSFPSEIEITKTSLEKYDKLCGVI